jgi:tripeptidyl-peptidase-2
LTSRVVDCIDATGAGDVKLREAKLVQDSKSLLLEGSSGRQLGLNPDWKNPVRFALLVLLSTTHATKQTGKWRVGHKAAYDLWPSDLVDRRKKERKAAFDKAQAALLASASRDLTAFEATVKPAEDLPEHSEDPNKLRKQDLKDKVSVLKELASSFEDAGPILDVVSWHDGKDWRAVVGGAEGDLSPDEVAPSLFEHSKAQEDKKASSLDLSKLKPMTDFRKERHFEKFGRQDLLSYSVNFYEDGEIVSIVVVSGSHGTHVAGIIAASHPEQPELNGVAPEAELVSIRIGDPRVKGMETSQALVRAATAIIETGCQLANMSFGEDGSWGTQQKGAFITQLVEEVVRKHDIIFVNSAGNNGPCLTTLGAIPAGSEAVFSIGAWVSEAMQDAEYALIDRVPASIYTWSSRGPAYDGSRGVLAYAPGGAITSVPLYNLKHTQLMNGTSMSSPNACGNIALLLSKLQQEGKQWTPARIRKALDLTSKDVGDPLGVGLIQIVDAYEHTLAHFQEADQDAEWLIQVIPPGRSQSMRGVYLRGAQETDRVQQFAIEVTPKFKLQDTSKAYDIDLQLSLHSDASWVEAPKFVAVNGLGRQFAIRVDPTKLETGLHATLLEGRLSNGRAVFKIPITVAKPTPAHPYSRINSSFKPGQLQRNFIAVPSGATWAEVTVKVTSDRPTPCQFWLHVVQLPNLQRLSETEMQSVYALTAGEPQSKKFKVKGGTTMELVATQSWNTSGKTDIELSIDFHGLSLATSQELTLNGANEFQKIELTSSIRPESISPTFKFESRRAVIRPKESKIHALSSRNNLASGQGQYELLLTYEFKQSKKAGVTPRFATDNYLYDGPFPVLSVLHDKTKRFMVWGE